MHYIYCPKCGKVIILLTNEYREIAMLRQNYLSERYWTYVAGFIKPGETAEETAYAWFYRIHKKSRFNTFCGGRCC